MAELGPGWSRHLAEPPITAGAAVTRWRGFYAAKQWLRGETRRQTAIF